MKLIVATNFDNSLIERIAEYPVVEVYGKLSRDIFGGGRPSYVLPDVGVKKLIGHIKVVHRKKIQFNYIMNSPCLDNMEFTRRGQKRITSILNRLIDAGVDIVTVSNPFLMEIIKTRFPHLKVSISVFAFVDDLQKVRYWENLGADSITLNSILINRDFDTLKKIRASSRCELTIMVNQCCVQSCNLSAPYHALTISHASQMHHPSGGFMIDYCFLRCSLMRMSEPLNFIKADWVRPEDLRLYEEMGYERFKIIERTAPTDVLVQRVKAYASRRYDGNFYDLIRQFIYDGADSNIKSRLRLFFTFFRPAKINPLKLIKIKRIIEKQKMLVSKLESPPVFIDNRKLDGFLEGHPLSCRNRDCMECRYCIDVASKSVSIDERYRQELISLYEDMLSELTTGRLWKW